MSADTPTPSFEERAKVAMACLYLDLPCRVELGEAARKLLAQLITDLQADLAACRKDKEGVEALRADYEERCHDMKQLRDLLGCDGSDWPQLREAVTTLRAQLAQATRDGVRLDWLDSQRQDIVQRDGNGDPELLGYGWGLQEQAHDIRTAIDMQIAALTPPPSAGTKDGV